MARDLTALRSEIDEVDRELLALLNRRAAGDRVVAPAERSVAAVMMNRVLPVARRRESRKSPKAMLRKSARRGAGRIPCVYNNCDACADQPRFEGSPASIDANPPLRNGECRAPAAK